MQLLKFPEIVLLFKQAQDNVLFSGKIEEYEAAFSLVDPEKKGDFPRGFLSIPTLQQNFLPFLTLFYQRQSFKGTYSCLAFSTEDPAPARVKMAGPSHITRYNRHNPLS